MRGSLSIAMTTQRVHIEQSHVRTWLRELRLSQDVTLNPRGRK